MTTYQPRLKQTYYDTVRAELQTSLQLKNVHQVPKLEKIVINAGLGKVKGDKKAFATAANTLAKITGQCPQTTQARLAIAGFKLRTGNEIGMKVTLRDERMYEFLERLITIVMPRLRDFRGASLRSFDQQGHYSIGFKEQAIFPELSFEETTPVHGLQATLVIQNASRQHSQALLEAFGFKFEKQETTNG